MDPAPRQGRSELPLCECSADALDDPLEFRPVAQTPDALVGGSEHVEVVRSEVSEARSEQVSQMKRAR